MTADAPPRVPDSTVLWRRVPPIHVSDGGKRLSSAAFGPHKEDGGTSVCVSRMAETPDAIMAGHEGYWLVEFTAGEARAQGFEIEVDDVDSAPYAGHANLVWSGSPSSRKRGQKKLAKVCVNRWKVRGRDD